MRQEALTSTRSVSQSSSHGKTRTVASLADAWIKMVDLYEFLVQNHVAPLTGAWIKTGSIIVARKRMNVASLADAWIKIIVPKTSKTLSLVASFA